MRTRESPSGDAAHVETEAIDRFARAWREDDKGQWFEAEQLAGFCLMIRRAALDAVRDVTPAPLRFSDEELSHRMRRGGYRLACCRDLFIHHFGSRSVASRPPEIAVGKTGGW